MNRHPSRSVLVLLIGLLVLAPMQNSLASLLPGPARDCAMHCKHHSSGDLDHAGMQEAAKSSHSGCDSQLQCQGQCDDCGHCQLVMVGSQILLHAVPARQQDTELPVYHGILPPHETPPPQFLQL